MWTCPYCGGTHGLPFHDSQLDGILCMEPDCGRFVDRNWDPDDLSEWDDTDL